MNLRHFSILTALTSVLFGSGCACEGTRHVRGSVTASDHPALSVDDAPNPSGRTPVAGATVWLTPTRDVADVNLCREQDPRAAQTDPHGYFEYSTFTGPVDGDCRAVCVRASGFEPYASPCLTEQQEYASEPWKQDVPEHQRQARYLNIVIVPRPPLPAPTKGAP
jgi:hypothetical protein